MMGKDEEEKYSPDYIRKMMGKILKRRERKGKHDGTEKGRSIHLVRLGKEKGDGNWEGMDAKRVN